MNINKDSKIPNSLAVPSRASFVVYLKSKDEIPQVDAWAEKSGLPLLIVGEGTNILPQHRIKGIVAVLNFKDMQLRGNLLQISAGAIWDDVVKFAIKSGLSGIEALSAIPGKAGAAPIQNIGAYGVEVGNVLEKVEVYDRKKKKFSSLSNSECKFGYRDSLFKKQPNRFIVVSLTLKLSKKQSKIPKYKDVENYFAVRKNTAPNLKQIRQAIIKIRSQKLPNYKIIPNCGSFFKNPIVSKKLAQKLKTKFLALSTFVATKGVKISAGFLIEQTGFKGKKIGKVEVSKNNAIVLTNPNKANFSDLIFAKNTIQKAVLAKFGVILEPEVNIIG